MARAMKPSGVEWLGDIPADWEICRIKNVASVFTGNSIKDEHKSFYEDPIEAIPYIATKDIDAILQTINFSNGMYVKQSDESFRRAPAQSTLLCIEGGNAGKKIAFTEREVCFVNKLCCFYTSICSNKYLYYQLMSPAFTQLFNSHIAGLIGGVSVNALKNFKILQPSLDEQQRIAAFLDGECARIDSVVEKTRASIEEYRKLKQAIITRAVTKGIRPNRPTKDSGIDWLGDIPADWELSKIKHNFTVYSGATPKSESAANWDGNIIWITPADYKTTDRYVSQGKRNISATGYNSCGTTLVPKGSIIFSKRAPIGTVAIAAVELCTNQGCLSCVPKADTDSGYYCYVMSAFTEQFNLYGTGTTFKEISYDVFCAFKVPRPPLDEQQEIADYLDEKTAAIDSLVAKKNRLVSELASLKKSLIFEYVTGKKEVPT